MCEVGDTTIEISEKTDHGKYEFLRTYYTIWNFITKGKPRVIIDTHAGTGIVEYKKDKKRIYGSAALAVIKTCAISNRLTIHLVEKNKYNFNILFKTIKDLQNGVQKFTLKKKIVKTRDVLNPQIINEEEINDPNLEHSIYPDTPDFSSNTYQKELIMTKAKFEFSNKDIEDEIHNIIAKYNESDIPDRNDPTKMMKPILLFLVDPCGMLKWDPIIKAIGEKANQQEGVEMILNWNTDTIIRNKKRPSFYQTMSQVYGMPENEVELYLKGCDSLDEYFEKYAKRLNHYWKYVDRLNVKKYTKIKPRAPEQPSYYLVFCTNNKAGHSIAVNKIKKIKTFLDKGNYSDIGIMVKKLTENHN